MYLLSSGYLVDIDFESVEYVVKAKQRELQIFNPSKFGQISPRYVFVWLIVLKK